MLRVCFSIKFKISNWQNNNRLLCEICSVPLCIRLQTRVLGKSSPDETRKRSFLLGELRLSHVKERTSILSKPRLNVAISTRFSPHLIFCLGIKFTSPHVTPHEVKFQVSHGIEVSSLERQLRSLTAKFGPKQNREYVCAQKVEHLSYTFYKALLLNPLEPFKHSFQTLW